MPKDFGNNKNCAPRPPYMKMPVGKPPGQPTGCAECADKDAVLQRLWDLVRFKRHAFFCDDELINEEEYALLAFDHPAVKRLETYDEMRAKIKQLKAKIESLEKGA